MAPTNREEKEKLVLELYHNKRYTYKQITTELRMSPNQISDILKKHEEKSKPIANKKQLSLSSQAYKLYSNGKTEVEVAIKLDIRQAHATQFHLEYLKLKGLDELVSLYVRTKGEVFYSLCKLNEELVVKRGMSIEQVANSVDIALNRLPYIEGLYEKAKEAVGRMQEKRDYLLSDIISLRKELIELEDEKRRRKLAPSFNHYRYYEEGQNSAMDVSSLYSEQRRPSPLPYWQSGLPDLSNEFRNEQEESK
jgi:transposase-like protein